MREVLRSFYVIPLRDLWGFAVWLWGLGGSTVDWRGTSLQLTRDGKITGTCGQRTFVYNGTNPVEETPMSNCIDSPAGRPSVPPVATTAAPTNSTDTTKPKR